MRISVIIPTYNEAASIGELITYLHSHADARLAEIIVADGGSTDPTVAAATRAGAVPVVSSRRCRAAQMNVGAAIATGEVLYFVHADCIPPATYLGDITEAIRTGYAIGCYRFRFQSRNPLLKINAYFTRFDRIMCRGGDQTLFVTRALFDQLGGYRDEYVIMEEYDFIIRARQTARFRIIPKEALVSARKYECNSYLRVNLANFVGFMLFFRGASPQTIRDTYHRILHSPR